MNRVIKKIVIGSLIASVYLIGNDPGINTISEKNIRSSLNADKTIAPSSCTPYIQCTKKQTQEYLHTVSEKLTHTIIPSDHNTEISPNIMNSMKNWAIKRRNEGIKTSTLVAGISLLSGLGILYASSWWQYILGAGGAGFGLYITGMGISGIRKRQGQVSILSQPLAHRSDIQAIGKEVLYESIKNMNVETVSQASRNIHKNQIYELHPTTDNRVSFNLASSINDPNLFEPLLKGEYNTAAWKIRIRDEE